MHGEKSSSLAVMISIAIVGGLWYGYAQNLLGVRAYVEKNYLPKQPKNAYDLAYDPNDTYAELRNMKDLELPATSNKDIVVKHLAYTLSYNEDHEQANWVAYRLESKNLDGKTKRNSDFRPDPAIQQRSALPDDYKASGYDRGHLAPSGDFKFSAQANSETFLMSNISPQVHAFNEGVWRALEEALRDWVRKDKIYYIVTGPVLQGKLKKIGKQNKVSVPDYYFKIVLCLEKEPKAIAFLMKNEASDAPLKSFVTSIDKIEELTGIDFFPALPDELEDKLESNIIVTQWFKK
ncbi:MAG TPA: DNA/RNA endonuclease [Microscillaceae bacterium]|jgi:endonuclease G|nr:DNA/RNA endonuclease [Microscillaceae bacterium]